MPTLPQFTNPILSRIGTFLNRFSTNAQRTKFSSRYAGEIPRDLEFTRFYEYYQGWPEIKLSINSTHRKLMGAKIEITSENEKLTERLERWCEIVNFKKKLRTMSLDMLITGTGFFEKQYVDEHGRILGNIEHIPTWTFRRVFRDDFSNVLYYEQLVEGNLTNLKPENLVSFLINNPENDGFGKSEFYSLAVPQKVAGKVDSEGVAINPDRYTSSILDRKARINHARMEIVEKQSKPQAFISIEGENDRERQKEIEDDISNEASSKWVHITNRPVTAVAAEISSAQSKFLPDLDEIRDQISMGGGYPLDTAIKGGDMGFASSETTMQDVSHRIADMQTELSENIQDDIFQQLCEQWGFDYEIDKPRLSIQPYIEKINYEQLINLYGKDIAPKEWRNMIREFVPGLDDEEYDKWVKEKKELEQIATSDGVEDTANTETPKNPRPEIEKDRPVSSNESLSTILQNPKLFETFLRDIVKSEIQNNAVPKITDDKVKKRLEEE